MELEKVMPVNRTTSFGAVETLKKAKKWFQDGEKPKHFLIFAQGTKSLGIPVLPAFLEQAVEGEENRIVFGEPISVPKGCRDYGPYKKLWIERVIEAEKSYEKVTGTKARKTVLDDEHKVRKYHAHQG